MKHLYAQDFVLQVDWIIRALVTNSNMLHAIGLQILVNWRRKTILKVMHEREISLLLKASAH